jgi:hypothetical protein
MEVRDRFFNYLLIAASLAAWFVVFQVVTTTYPRENPSAGLAGAGAIGLAFALTTSPLFWLVPFARHRRIAFRGDWSRALRRSTWVGIVVALFVALRIQGVLSPPIVVFVIVLVLLAEVTLSFER